MNRNERRERYADAVGTASTEYVINPHKWLSFTEAVAEAVMAIADAERERDELASRAAYFEWPLPGGERLRLVGDEDTWTLYWDGLAEDHPTRDAALAHARQIAGEPNE